MWPCPRRPGFRESHSRYHHLVTARRLPTSLRTDIDTITLDDGRKPVAIPDDLGFIAEIKQTPDGMLYVARTPIDPSEYALPLRDLTYTDCNPIQVIDEYTAAQVALARVLLSLRWLSIDREALVNGDGFKASTRAYGLQVVAFDWPSWGTEADSQARAVITEGAPSIYTTRDFGTEYEESTLEVFLPETVLRVYGSAACTFKVEIVFAHKDERASFRGAFVRALMGDPARDAGGRRIVVPEYFKQPVRLTLDDTAGVSFPDNPEESGRGRFPFVAEVLADVEVLGLVPAQAMLNPGADVRL